MEKCDSAGGGGGGGDNGVEKTPSPKKKAYKLRIINDDAGVTENLSPITTATETTTTATVDAEGFAVNLGAGGAELSTTTTSTDTLNTHKFKTTELDMEVFNLKINNNNRNNEYTDEIILCFKNENGVWEVYRKYGTINEAEEKIDKIEKDDQRNRFNNRENEFLESNKLFIKYVEEQKKCLIDAKTNKNKNKPKVFREDYLEEFKKVAKEMKETGLSSEIKSADLIFNRAFYIAKQIVDREQFEVNQHHSLKYDHPDYGSPSGGGGGGAGAGGGQSK